MKRVNCAQLHRIRLYILLTMTQEFFLDIGLLSLG